MPSAPFFFTDGDLLGQLDIGREDDVAAIEGGRGGFAKLGELLLDLGLLDLELAIFPERLVAGIEDEQAVVAVEEDVVAALDDLAEMSCRPTTAGMFMRPGHDGGVRGAAADVGGEAEDELAIELGGVRRGEIVGDEDVRAYRSRRGAGSACPSGCA